MQCTSKARDGSRGTSVCSWTTLPRGQKQERHCWAAAIADWDTGVHQSIDQRAFPPHQEQCMKCPFPKSHLLGTAIQGKRTHGDVQSCHGDTEVRAILVWISGNWFRNVWLPWLPEVFPLTLVDLYFLSLYELRQSWSWFFCLFVFCFYSSIQPLAIVKSKETDWAFSVCKREHK